MPQIQAAGEYFLFEAGRESIIVVRQDESTINAFYNVCRHRGSRICLEQSGRKHLLTCPYHAWSYGLDGSLKSARLMPESFAPSAHGLHRCHVDVFEGLVFVNLSHERPPTLESLWGGWRDGAARIRRRL